MKPIWVKDGDKYILLPHQWLIRYKGRWGFTGTDLTRNNAVKVFWMHNKDLFGSVDTSYVNVTTDMEKKTWFIPLKRRRKK
jgi:hypothetical protein